jgi:hypothetical protein
VTELIAVDGRKAWECPGCRVLHRLHAGPAELDSDKAGVSFIDVLFGLVVAAVATVAISQATTNLKTAFVQSAVSSLVVYTQLAVAFVLTVTSWVGYHGSHQRSRFKLKFVNLPLLQFTDDVLLLGLYSAAVFTVSGSGFVTSESGRAQVVVLACVFLGYVLWDSLSEWMRGSNLYRTVMVWRPVKSSGEPTFSYRFLITGAFFLIISISAAAVWLTEPVGGALVAVNIGIIVLLILYRALQDYFGGKQDLWWIRTNPRPAATTTAS